MDNWERFVYKLIKKKNTKKNTWLVQSPSDILTGRYLKVV